jgi:ABC-type Fe3+ transport system permease subunit
MSTLLFALLMSLLAAALGVALIISPRWVLELNDRLAQLDRWTTLKRGPSVGDVISYRVAGAMVATFGMVCLYYIVPALLGFRPYHVTHAEPAPAPVAGGVTWSSIALSLLVAVLGVFLLLKPTVVEWYALKVLRQRRDVGDIKIGKTSLIFVRVLGLAFLLYSVLQIFHQFALAN